MFTGLVEALGHVVSLESRGPQARLTLRAPFAAEVAEGDSVAVNGCCLTVTGHTDAEMSFDVLAQTLKVTSLGVLGPGSVVNLERALAAGDRFGGHFVLGHVDVTGSIRDVRPLGQDYRVEVALPPEISRLCIDKGSLAVDGISLTIAELGADSAVFWITPHTWLATNLHAAAPGQPVNLEADMLAKHVDKLLEARFNPRP